MQTQGCPGYLSCTDTKKESKRGGFSPTKIHPHKKWLEEAKSGRFLGFPSQGPSHCLRALWTRRCIFLSYITALALSFEQVEDITATQEATMLEVENHHMVAVAGLQDEYESRVQGKFHSLHKAWDRSEHKNKDSCQISEDKQGRPWLVFGWETYREYQGCDAKTNHVWMPLALKTLTVAMRPLWFKGTSLHHQS